MYLLKDQLLLALDFFADFEDVAGRRRTKLGGVKRDQGIGAISGVEDLS